MRLTAAEQSAIVAAAEGVWGREARVSLFGSRVDDRARGGDIDLLVRLAATPTPAEWVAQRQAFVARLYRALDERRIDVLLDSDSAGLPHELLASARRRAVPLQGMSVT